MLVINVPIGEFITRAIQASLYCDYTAFLSIIARTADGEAIQSELLKNWGSFNDLTHNLILVLSPNPLTKDSRNAHVISPEGFYSGHWESSRAVASEGLWFNHQISSRLERSFSYSKDYQSDALGYYSSRMPRAIKDHKFAITSAATETARFFGISEAWIPCVVILSIKEKIVFFIYPNEEFSLYNLTRSILINYEPHAREVENIKTNISKLSSIISSKKDSLSTCRRSIEKAVDATKIIGQEWIIQRESICGLLLVFSEKYPCLAVDVRFFINYLYEKEEKILGISNKVDAFLTRIREFMSQKYSFNEEREFRKISQKLRKSIKKIHQIDEQRKVWELRKEKLQEKIRTLESEIPSLESEIPPLERELRSLCHSLEIYNRNNKFSNAIFAAINGKDNYNFSQEYVNVNLPDCLRNWQTILLNQKPPIRSSPQNETLLNQLTQIIGRMAEAPKIQMNINSPAQNVTGNVQGDQIINPQTIDKLVLAEELRRLIEEQRKVNPSLSQAELARVAIHNNPTFKTRLLSAGKSAAIEAIKLIPGISVPVEAIRGWFENE